jgi:orotidine-5'-phosphate decarboxylase
MENFADRLLEAIDKKQNPVCIGLDPRIGKIPQYIRKEKIDEYGNNKTAVAEAFVEFNREIIKQTHDIVPAYKPQMAFYEQYGLHGIHAFERTVDAIKSNGCIVIEDAKRNDIGSTSKAYSDGHLGEVELCDGSKEPSFDVDAITVNGYLGSDCIKPFVENCKERGKGIFVLVKTSNPSSGELQDVKAVATENVYSQMALLVNKWGREVVGDSDYSSVGAVVGATYPEQAVTARRLMPDSIILVPGYGAQGGGGKDTLPNFNEDGQGAIVNSSRGIIFAYQKDPFKRDETDFGLAAKDAAIAMREDIVAALKGAGISRWK